MLWTPRKSLLQTPWLWVPKPLGFASPGGYPCCCPTSVCRWCNNSIPNQVEVVISGVLNRSCGTCTNVNGTFVLDYYGEVLATPGGSAWMCEWFYTLPSAICPYNYLMFTISSGVYDLILCENKPWTGAGDWQAYFRLNTSQPFDCENIDDDLPSVWTSHDMFECESTHGTCHVTAL